jgi:hypothetical protein
MKNKEILFLLGLTLSIAGSYSQKPVAMQPAEISPMQLNAPMIGAEIFIEPGSYNSDDEWKLK